MLEDFDPDDDALAARQGLWNSGDDEKTFVSGDLVMNDQVCAIYNELPESPDITHPNDARSIIPPNSMFLVITRMNEFYYMVFCSSLCKYAFVWDKWLMFFTPPSVLRVSEMMND